MLRLFRGYRVLVILFRGAKGVFCIHDERTRPFSTPRSRKISPKEKSPACAGLEVWRSREVAVKSSQKSQERRSAVQVPEQSPPAAVQVPAPSVPDMRPVPVALLSPLETVTVIAPFAPTLPATLKEAVPA